ncbi:hypothetical protein CBG04_07895 [Limosilactobacillus reuteri]|uniref:hypothetical protein n=1 Tax=Limosilactobacillus reuteri TaxID=1598 RepID=UPI000B99AB7F|nr:hypothetical protein [Limosilactobacillus reuteri]OYS78996.1 hypothetical protein CBG11_10555 [Limosilactobacillus reuteri]OYS82702.1 hypothetical protein CBG04_07895 [Limosilactobacillus reuteri]OYS84348.1 hypothetical protein CBG14_05680 [Limosilactobacillus reuteri]
MADLIRKYDIPYHLDKLEQRYGNHIVMRTTDKLEDVIPASDMNLQAILAFRRATAESDRTRKPNKTTKTAAEIAEKNYWLIESYIKQGKTINYIAKMLKMSSNGLYNYVQKHRELRDVYNAKKHRTAVTAPMVEEMKYLVSCRLTHQQIADKLGLKKSQVDWQLRKHTREQMADGR